MGASNVQRTTEMHRQKEEEECKLANRDVNNAPFKIFITSATVL